MHIGLTILYDLHKFSALISFLLPSKTSKSTKYDDTFFSSLYIFQDTLVPIVYSFVSDPFHKNKPLPFYLSLRLFLYNDFFLSLLFPLYLIPEILDTKTAITTMNPFFIRQILNILSNLPESALCCDIFCIVIDQTFSMIFWTASVAFNKDSIVFLNYIYQNKCLLFLLSLPVFRCIVLVPYPLNFSPANNAAPKSIKYIFQIDQA